jgi:hypothetical protein
LFKRLRDKTFSKRGFSWSGKLLSSLLLTLTHTYPLEDKFVNRDEWDSEGKLRLYSYVFLSNLYSDFRFDHHKSWGKLYTAEDVTVCVRFSDYSLSYMCDRFRGTYQTTKSWTSPWKYLRRSLNQQWEGWNSF